MSSDYRPRGGGDGGGGRGGRRRRGGRGRSGHGHHGSHGEHRSHANGHSAPKKKESLIDKLIGFFKPKKKQQEHAVRPSTPRPDFKERTPRAEHLERSERPRREDRPERVAKAEPTPQEITSTKLYVGNLAYEAAESDLFDLFSKVGHVKNVEVAMDRRSGRSKGFGFVEMDELESAKSAAEKLNRTDFMGRQIVVSGAKVDKRPVTPREESAESSESHSSESSDTPSEAGGNPESTL